MKKAFNIVLCLVFIAGSLLFSPVQAGDILHEPDFSSHYNHHWQGEMDIDFESNSEFTPPTAESLALTQEQVNSFDCSTVTDVDEIECEALVALYASTNGAGWENSTGWLQATTVSDWFGVSVFQGHVTDLFLSDNQLSGSIPVELSNLSNLISLLLSFNQLSGSIPVGLGNLSNLESVNLSWNQLSGPIPAELGNLENLERLNLGNNQLSGEIPADLGNLVNNERNLNNAEFLGFGELNDQILIGSDGLQFEKNNPIILNQANENSEFRSTGGPDNFGYSWAPETLNWVDAGGGTDTGMTGYSFDQATGPISLPFPFNFYGFEYSEVYIAASGYISFSDSTAWPWQQMIPSVSEPNNVVAPFWSPNEINDDTSWVRYDSGGSEPERFFVVEWHEVTFLESSYTFQLILYENGDIVFQYATMEYIGFGSSGGIEDKYGVDGLSLGEGYNYEPLSNSAVRITRPQDSARVGFARRYFGSFTQAEKITEFEVNFTNTGDFGEDTYNLTSVSNWDIAFYDSSGSPLIDSSGDGIPDTGSIPQGSSTLILIRISTPPSAVVGEENKAVVTFTSTNDPDVSDIISITTALPFPFSQSYALISEDKLHLDIFHPQAEFNTVVGNRHNSRSTAIAETEEGFILVINSEESPEPGLFISEIWFTLLDRSGNILELESKLTNHSGEELYHRDSSPTVVTAPNGKIGIAWSRTTYDVTTDLSNSNVYYAILDEAGDIITPATNITNNLEWVDTFPYYRDVVITATQDNRFVLAWERQSTVDGIFTAIVESSGNIVQPMTNIDWLNGNGGHTLLALEDGNFLLAYYLSNPFGNDYLYYLIMDNYGAIVKPKTTINMDIGGAHVHIDSVQVMDGTIIMSWILNRNPDNIWLVSLDGTNYDIKSDIDYFSNPLAQHGNGNISLTSTTAGDAILTWSESTIHGYNHSSNLYYAIIGSDCNLVSQPMIFKSGESIVPLSIGYSNTSFSGVPPVVTSENAVSFIEGTFENFEITASGVPHPVISYTNTLPDQVEFIDNGDGTGNLVGAPSAGTGGVYPITFDVSNGVLPDGTQEFTLKVKSVKEIDLSGGTIVNNNGNTEVSIPEGSVDSVTEFSFEPFLEPTENTGSLNHVGIAFQLTAKDISSGAMVTTFNPPLRITVRYDSISFNEVLEESLMLYYWNGSIWEDAACGDYERNLEENWFSVDICHLSEFAVLGDPIDVPGFQIYLPLIIN